MTSHVVLPALDDRAGDAQPPRAGRAAPRRAGLRRRDRHRRARHGAARAARGRHRRRPPCRRWPPAPTCCASALEQRRGGARPRASPRVAAARRRRPARRASASAEAAARAAPARLRTAPGAEPVATASARPHARGERCAWTGAPARRAVRPRGRVPPAAEHGRCDVPWGLAGAGEPLDPTAPSPRRAPGRRRRRGLAGRRGRPLVVVVRDAAVIPGRPRTLDRAAWRPGPTRSSSTGLARPVALPAAAHLDHHPRCVACQRARPSPSS